MKKIIFAIVILLYCCNISSGQISIERQVIGSTGNLTNTGTIQASSNVGETVITTTLQSNLIVTQGFEQPDTMFTTGINIMNNIKFNIYVYPNPVSNELIIETNFNTEQKFEIINMVGQTLYTSNINKKATVNTSTFANGVYILKLYTNKETLVRKFVKE